MDLAGIDPRDQTRASGLLGVFRAILGRLSMDHRHRLSGIGVLGPGLALRGFFRLTETPVNKSALTCPPGCLYRRCGAFIFETRFDFSDIPNNLPHFSPW